MQIKRINHCILTVLVAIRPFRFIKFDLIWYATVKYQLNRITIETAISTVK